MSVSVIVITKNEESSLGRCLKSIQWADEIVVVDSGSTDNTAQIAQAYRAKVFTEPWSGFGPQKNKALLRASCDWVLSLDADEWVSDSLGLELRQAALSSNVSGFRAPRLSCFCGRFIRHSGWWPDYVIRFFRRRSARFSDDLVHERLLIEGPIATLKSPLLHEPYRNLDQLIDKMNRYSTLGAEGMRADGKRGSLSDAIGRGAWAFIRTYLLRAGFLDGREGFIVSVATAQTTYYRYLKLAYLTRDIHSETHKNN